jgi:hypothetical protein
MPRTKADPAILARKERVKAAVELRGVPEGTEGRVMLRNGLDWIRYWVAFDNGVEMGSLGREKLVRVREWDKFLVERAAAAEAALTAPEADDSDDDDDGSATSDGEGVTVNGVVVPQLLIDRTQGALERFGVSR